MLTMFIVQRRKTLELIDYAMQEKGDRDNETKEALKIGGLLLSWILTHEF